MKRFLSIMLSIVLVVSLLATANVQEAKAYGIDYNYVDNVLNEVGYGDWYDDTLSIIGSSYNAVGGFDFTTGMPARYYVSTINKLNSKTVITPMTQKEFTECSYNIAYGRTKIEITEEMTEEQIVAASKTYLTKIWNEHALYQELNMNFTSTGTFRYATAYGGALSDIAGSELVFIGINDSKVTTVTVKASSVENFGDYAFANFTALKNLEFSIEGSVQEFPYAFGYRCSSLKYLTYPQGKDYVFGKYAFANCSSLIHWTGLGKNGATQNWNNTTTPDSSYVFKDYSFAGCNNITHNNFVSANVTLNQYSFGNSGLSYIGFFDYNYYDKEDSLLESYKGYATALMGANSISDKAFDGVPSNRIYVAHKEIYDIMNMYEDGKYCGRTLAVANIQVSFDDTDTTSGSMENKVIRYDDDVYTLMNGYEKQGYSFVGFSSDSMSNTLADNYNAPHNGTDWIDALGTTIGQITLYPTWMAGTWNITYVLNGGETENINLPEYHTYGESITYLESPTRAGYEFVGWYEDENFTIPFKGIVSTDMSEHTYYAKWEEKSVIYITYVLNDGKNHPDNPTTLSYNDGRFDLLEATREGYAFKGWTTGNNDEYITYILPSMGDMTLYAVWTVAQYPITYELNGGDSESVELPEYHTYGENITSLDTPTRAGYDFAGWYEDEYFTIPFKGIISTDTSEHTYYAKWEEHVIRITYELDGGTNNPENPDTLPFSSVRVDLKEPSKTGYDFLYWTNGENDEKVTYLMAANGDQTLHAVWKPHVYSISYELNGGVLTGEVPTEYTFNKICYLVVPPIKEKYVFDGWYMDADLKKRVYDISVGTQGDITLYAKWSEAVAILPIPTKKGYRFLGWVDKKGKSISITDRLKDHEGNIYSHWLDVRWTIKNRNTKAYVNTIKSCYKWYQKKEKKGDVASFTETTPNGTIKIYGVADGYVTKKDISITISGDIESIYLERNGKEVKISKSYFKKKNADNIYLKGFPITKDGEYELSVSSATETKKITFMRDSSKPIINGTETRKIVKESTLSEAVKRTTKKVTEKGNTKTITVKKGTTKTVTKTKYETFKIDKSRTMYIQSEQEESYIPSISWKDTTVGVSTVYINGKKLSAKKIKKGTYTLKKAGTYKIEVYDYIGNRCSKTIKVSETYKDWKLPIFNMKDGATYATDSTISVIDKDSGMQSLVVTDWHGFKHKIKGNKYTFKTAGTYVITASDKAGNVKSIKVKIVQKTKY